MFDNLRNDSSFFDDNSEEVKAAPSKQTSTRPKHKKKGQLLGMTPMQRFIVTMMLLIAVSLLGTVALLLTGKFWLA